MGLMDYLLLAMILGYCLWIALRRKRHSGCCGCCADCTVCNKDKK